MNTGNANEPGEPSAVDDSVTLLLTDIEGSTRLVEALGDRYPPLVERSRELIREAVAAHAGTELDAQGDGVFAAFRSGSNAARAAIAIQRRFHHEPWPAGAPVRVRIAVHTGEPQCIGGAYFGLDVHRTARIAGVARGGQVILSAAARAQLQEGDLEPHITIRDLGSYRLKDLRYPEVLFDLRIPDLPAPRGSERPFESRPNNLPLASTSFVGREHDLDAVCRLLVLPLTRLLTLTGAGGTGKTRLAVECGRTLLGRFRHGVYLVPMAAVSDADLVPTIIVQTLGLPIFGHRSPLESLVHHLSQREMLLVMDNLEHLPGAAAPLVELLNACPHTKVLATSREPLNVRSEREYLLPPLPVPDPSIRSGSPALARCDAVRLFVERVQSFDPRFTLTPENAEAVAAICRRLDGLPLALELAATWLRLYTPAVLLQRLDHALDVLTTGPRDLERHQRTLRDTIAWSCDLLGDGERSTFRRLAVLRGGATLDSALALTEDDATRDPAADLMALVRKNLVTHAATEGHVRIGMLETIREYALRELERTGAHAALRRRHAEHYLALAETMAPGLTGRHQRRFVTALMADQDNLRGALEWAIQAGDVTMTSRLFAALLWLWIPRGQFAEGHDWARRALGAFARHEPSRDTAVIREAAGWLEVLAGNYPAALPHFERSYELFAASADPDDRARANLTLGVTCLVLGDERGAALGAAALALAPVTRDRTIRALVLLAAGIQQQIADRTADAERWYRQALSAFQEADNVFWPGQALQNLAVLRLQLGDPIAAAALAFDAFDLGREYDYPMIRNLSLSVIAGTAVARGDAPLAARLFGVVSASLRELGVTFEPPDQAFMQMNVDAAKAALGEAFTAAFDEGRVWTEHAVLAAVQPLRGQSTLSPTAAPLHL